MIDSKNLCSIYLVRHGESQANVENIWGGDTQLTDQGRSQATEVAQKLNNEKIDAIYCSDLIRAQQTAQIIALPHLLEPIVSPNLREKFYGELEGCFHSDLEPVYGAKMEEYWTLSHDEMWHHKITEQCESSYEAFQRFKTELDQIVINHLSKKVVIVSHANLMKSLLVHLKVGSFTDIPKEALQNTAIIKLKSDGQVYTLGHN